MGGGGEQAPPSNGGEDLVTEGDATLKQKERGKGRERPQHFLLLPVSCQSFQSKDPNRKSVGKGAGEWYLGSALCHSQQEGARSASERNRQRTCSYARK